MAVSGSTGRRAVLLCVCAAAISAAYAQAPAPGVERRLEPIRILFIGNSYTYTQKLPLALIKMAAASAEPLKIETAEVVVSGATLQQHWAAGNALAEIQKGVWDWVVLQDHSVFGAEVAGPDGGTLPGSPERFFEFARLFNAEIRKTKARTLFYMTWAREQSPEGQARLTEAYRDIAEELSAAVAPVGLAFMNARIGDPNLRLYQTDHSHPSPAGTYLAACVFYSVITGRSPVGLPRTITDEAHKPNEPAIALYVPQEEAAHLQRVAWRTVLADPSYENFPRSGAPQADSSR
jgi:hypothetical protein